MKAHLAVNHTKFFLSFHVVRCRPTFLSTEDVSAVCMDKSSNCAGADMQMVSKKWLLPLEMANMLMPRVLPVPVPVSQIPGCHLPTVLKVAVEKSCFLTI